MNGNADAPRREAPKIILGAETEYGIFSTTNGEQYFHDIYIGAMLDECVAVAELFNGARDTISNLEEHSAIEAWIARCGKRKLNSDERALLRRGENQRRGISGIKLVNGARFYQDMSHPEYSIPETTNPRDALVAERAGDRIVELCRARAESKLKLPPHSLLIHKNNSDGFGASYAGHENYSLSPRLFERIYSDGMHPERSWGYRDSQNRYYSVHTALVFLFFVTRQIIIGSGKVGSEYGATVPFQISQRSDFFSRLFSIDTTKERGLINLRDYPYGNSACIRRFHVIVADSNMSELSIFLKHGITGLFFMMLEGGSLCDERESIFPALKDPLRAHHAVSRDLTLREKLDFWGGMRFSALEIQRQFAKHARRFVSAHEFSSVWTDVVEKWEGVLDGLEGKRYAHPLSRSLDWVAKERLIAATVRKSGVGPLDGLCKGRALAYHDTNHDNSIFYVLEKRGDILRLTSEAEVESAICTPPSDTRAWIRSEIIKRYGAYISHMGWDVVELSLPGKDAFVELSDPFWGGAGTAADIVGDNPTIEEFLSRLKSLPSRNVRVAYLPLWKDKGRR